MPFLQSSVNSREGDFPDNSFQTGSSSHYEVIPAMTKKFGMVESDTSGNAATTSDEEEE